MFVDGSRPLEIKNTVNGEVITVEPQLDGSGNFVPKSVFKTGEPVTYGLDYCKYRSVPATLQAHFVDTAIIEMPVFKSNVPVGCGKIIMSDNHVPKLLPSGKYYLRVDIDYQVNPLRKVTVSIRTKDFQIINTVK